MATTSSFDLQGVKHACVYQAVAVVDHSTSADHRMQVALQVRDSGPPPENARTHLGDLLGLPVQRQALVDGGGKDRNRHAIHSCRGQKVCIGGEVEQSDEDHGHLM